MTIETKSKVIAILLVVCGLLAVVGGPALSDYAKTSFGWTLGDILTWVGAFGFIGGIVWLYKLSYK